MYGTTTYIQDLSDLLRVGTHEAMSLSKPSLSCEDRVTDTRKVQAFPLTLQD